MSAFESVGAILDNVTEPKWYAVYTRVFHEKRVSDHFSARNIEFYLPTYKAKRRWKNRCNVELDLPLFPAYLFARIPWCEHSRVLEVPSVVSIVSNGRRPLPLPESEINALRAGLKLVNSQPHAYLNIGERVRIKSGPLTGLEGIVLREGNNLRVVLAVELIMQSIVVEAEQWDLEPARRE